ncbi:hypothetical protein [Leuconostoc fallax]|uniref:Uncharacterized protein n=1 Tax=Leuconostoc fallax TaxID=1251 RepID=A0A4R5NA70_9LACO|nr:hypothetical protein [Leuconostoc fallax]MBU7456394.1 hypothetical protein [Leuconostoc fallax]TDG69393.1 hypothetical protein C5L23_000855 [Leuconostoc fallax]
MKKGVLIGIISSLVTLVVCGIAFYTYSELQDDRDDRTDTPQEQSTSTSYSQSGSGGSSTTSSSSSSSMPGGYNLPSQDKVNERLNSDLDKFVQNNSTDIHNGKSNDELYDMFEDQYVDAYENELERKHGESQDDAIEKLLDQGVANLNFNERITAAKQ